jgi:hypothetical protein
LVLGESEAPNPKHRITRSVGNFDMTSLFIEKVPGLGAERRVAGEPRHWGSRFA